MSKLLIQTIAMGIICCASSTALSDSPMDILVIVNNSSEIEATSTTELRNIFLKIRSKWARGGRVTPINAKAGSILRIAFIERLLQMTQRDEASYWQANKIKTGLTEPSEFGNTMKVVYKIRGAVSYVFRSHYKDGVAKVVLVIPTN
jgi:hypothetical protein